MFHGADALDDRAGDAGLILVVRYEKSLERGACSENVAPCMAENKDAPAAADGFCEAHCVARKRFATIVLQLLGAAKTVR